MNFNQICVIGLGYIGLPTSLLFAKNGLKVIGVDTNQSILNTLSLGLPPIQEYGIENLIEHAISKQLLVPRSKPESSDAFIIAVPTPFVYDSSNPSSIPSPDISFIYAACNSIAPVLKKGDLVILESTSPVGTSDLISKQLEKLRPDLKLPHSHSEASDIFIAYCPERVIPGNIFQELVFNDRIIGGITPASAEIATSLYKLFVRGRCISTDSKTAELCKLAENAYRDVNIGFANELSIVASEYGINANELIHISNLHPRVNILQPGIGVGGHCIAVDPWFIVKDFPDQTPIIQAARKTNDLRPKWISSKIRTAIDSFAAKSPHKEISICILGLSYKPDVDDLRESPAVLIAKELCNIFAGKISIAEPFVSKLPDELCSTSNLINFEEALNSCDILVLLVPHKLFLDEISKESLESKCIIDPANFLLSKTFYDEKSQRH
ncbi:UDP-N-acetyl-D-mannosamine dehydrogenase [Polynucleobacter sp. AP-Feld-500C-C5]|uniref:UDP-N-acetyl-D-mannosamine dehydrogenase n=1 Tax=Polynucleobacter sp. AP-Feld-500C-C5 TaxID=2576924 RepID=UPI001C0B3F11|nr:UDP-N-acetyl-D-mannosamine dehydrogenase [Polynucleobacter sp. AP-Feld-500C-C5]MBU3632881.1 UDP-N-acetyl-D-mannosamine dehydrogenase [Polynucleobacter sp. AP-Feld-500C-C5]